MNFKDSVIQIVKKHPNGISPPDIQREIEKDYPHFFGTESHVRNYEKGHYTDLHHALKAQVYGLVRRDDVFFCDKSQKPYLVTIAPQEIDDELPEEENFESDYGKVYILDTGTFTKNGKKIIKIGQTNQNVEKRIAQLYTTGVPFEFSIIKVYEVQNHIELESAIHKLLTQHRLNKSREFFTSEVIPFVDEIVKIHNRIHDLEITN